LLASATRAAIRPEPFPVHRDEPAPDLRHGSETPLYVSLARALTEEISNGHHPVGTLLPTEETLARTHAVSRQTVREALRLLHAQGLVSRRRGIGTRVLGAAPKRRFTIEIESFNDFVEMVNRVRLRVSSIEPILATGRLAEQLGCREGSRWLVVRAVRCLTDCPDSVIAVMECYLRDQYPDIEQALHEIGETAIHRMLEHRYGEQMDEIHQEISAVSVSPHDAARLGVEPYSPGLRIERRFLGRGGRVVFAGHLVYPGETFSFSGSFRRGSWDDRRASLDE
jgi:DNA-binding GntR family transcriptional regulator